MTEAKRCSACGERKPLSEYYPNKKSPDGLRYECIPCCKARALAYHREQAEARLKRCRRCKETKLRACFPQLKTCISDICVTCGGTAEERAQKAAEAKRRGKLRRVAPKCQGCRVRHLAHEYGTDERGKRRRLCPTCRKAPCKEGERRRILVEHEPGTQSYQDLERRAAERRDAAFDALAANTAAALGL